MVDWLGALDFLQGLWGGRTNLASENAVAYAIADEAADEINVFIEVTLINRSTASIAITGGILSVSQFSGPIVIGQKMLLGTGPSGAGSPDVCIASSQLPFSLPPKEACRKILLSRCQKRNSYQLLPLQVELPSNVKERLFHPALSESDGQNSLEPLPVSLLLNTSRRKVPMDLTAVPGDAAQALRRARSEKWIRDSS